MLRRIEKVAVLGAGTMGARISAHLANAGVPSYLLDIVPPDADGPARNRCLLAAGRRSSSAGRGGDAATLASTLIPSGAGTRRYRTRGHCASRIDSVSCARPVIFNCKNSR